MLEFTRTAGKSKNANPGRLGEIGPKKRSDRLGRRQRRFRHPILPGFQRCNRNDGHIVEPQRLRRTFHSDRHLKCRFVRLGGNRTRNPLPVIRPSRKAIAKLASRPAADPRVTHAGSLAPYREFVNGVGLDREVLRKRARHIRRLRTAIGDPKRLLPAVAHSRIQFARGMSVGRGRPLP